MMKVSVIIPCYNAADYIDACLTSLLAQSMDDFEAIVVDDGSLDETLSIVRAFERADARVRVLMQNNAGVSAARNRALDAARGEWVTFLDSDDILPVHALRTLLAVADAQTDMVVGAHECFGKDGKHTVRPDTNWPTKPTQARRHAVALRLIEGDAVLNIMCGKLIRRSLIEREGLRLAEEITVAEDALFNLEAALLSRNIVYVDETVYRYRMHDGSKMHTQTKGALAIHTPWLRGMRAMLVRRGLLEMYFPAYLDSVVLRLYKDSGVFGVVTSFKRAALPLLNVRELDVSKLNLHGRLLRILCLSGTYPAIYPLVLPFQILRRKLSAAVQFCREYRRAES